MPTKTRQQARDLRKGATKAEQRLWLHLRAGRLGGMKFRRQHPIPPYVVDFYCEAAKLVVELDGSQHNEDADAPRTRYLESFGIKVLRYWDNEVLQQTEAVLESILSAGENRTLTPTPLPAGEGL
ncbi:endonuclease domain-containing protein [Rhodanobacter terrae]|uniref:Endonuclease domain-containing protein n=1 Tax=Rhodanobacter terrae TaxID=418647 RepID=A0ABW0SZV3_9GAMM